MHEDHIADMVRKLKPVLKDPTKARFILNRYWRTRMALVWDVADVFRAANELEVEVLAAVRTGAKSIFVNLAGATFLCSAGIRVLLQYHRQMKGKGLTFLATRPSSDVAAALEMTGFPELVEK